MGTESEIIELIRQRGPLTGGEIWEVTGGDGLALWRTCTLSPRLSVRKIGVRYLRLDRRIQGFARLSPSIFREFLTYSIVGFPEDRVAIEEKARRQMCRIEEVSRAKSELAYRTVCGLTSRLDSEWDVNEETCFLLAGDIVFNMAHDVPRPERSTGKLVNGSDMDLVVVTQDHVPEGTLRRLDDLIFQEKYRLLITPHLREEIDYVVKRLARVREQIRFDTFKHMVACKILHEGAFLCGNEELFHEVKSWLHRGGVVEKLDELEKRAGKFRAEAEERLLDGRPEQVDRAALDLFYPVEESEEFE